jgi:3-phosphoshikimate 1-carboxyvinyltransferase
VRLDGELILPGDKSIAHRALMLAALSVEESRLSNFPSGSDVRSTLTCLQQCGLQVSEGTDELLLKGGKLHTPATTLNCGNSGSTVRMLAGLLAGAGLSATFDGDSSLRQRPLARVIIPLEQMGAHLNANDGRLPVRLAPGRLSGGHFKMEVASAQVKSALLLAGLGAYGTTIIQEPTVTRNHTELMLKMLGVSLEVDAGTLTLQPHREPLPPLSIKLPGDPSTAAAFITGCAILPGSRLLVRGMSLNRTRIRFLEILQQMGLVVEFQEKWYAGAEEVGDLMLEGPARLHPFTVAAEEVPLVIDELPLLAVAACQAEGVSQVTGAAELRVKESDRIEQVCKNLKLLGAQIEELPDGFVIEGGHKLRGGRIVTAMDHRIAMAMRIAGLLTDGEVVLDETVSMAVSCPEFDRLLTQLLQ